MDNGLYSYVFADIDQKEIWSQSAAMFNNSVNEYTTIYYYGIIGHIHLKFIIL